MKNIIQKILEDYLTKFKDEAEKLKLLEEFIHKSSNSNLTDWNNFEGHIVASGFLYAKKEKRFLVLFHKDLRAFLYPGGHIDETDTDPLAAAKREISEETGIEDMKLFSHSEYSLTPLDIDIHEIPYNDRLGLPNHRHFDFRYLFTIDSIEQVVPDSSEMGKYRWINLDEIKENCNFGAMTNKLENLINQNRL